MGWTAILSRNPAPQPGWEIWSVSVEIDFEDLETDEWYWAGELFFDDDRKLWGGNSGEIIEEAFLDSGGICWEGWIPSGTEAFVLRLKFSIDGHAKHYMLEGKAPGSFSFTETPGSFQQPPFQPAFSQGTFSSQPVAKPAYGSCAVPGLGIFSFENDETRLTSEQSEIISLPEIPHFSQCKLLAPEWLIVYTYKRFYVVSLKTWKILLEYEAKEFYDWDAFDGNGQTVCFQNGYLGFVIFQLETDRAKVIEFHDDQKLEMVSVSIAGENIAIGHAFGMVWLSFDGKQTRSITLPENHYLNSTGWRTDHSGKLFACIRTLVVCGEETIAELSVLDLAKQRKYQFAVPSGFGGSIHFVSENKVLVISRHVAVADLTSGKLTMYGEGQKENSLSLTQSGKDLIISGMDELNITIPDFY